MNKNVLFGKYRINNSTCLTVVVYWTVQNTRQPLLQVIRMLFSLRNKTRSINNIVRLECLAFSLSNPNYLRIAVFYRRHLNSYTSYVVVDHFFPSIFFLLQIVHHFLMSTCSQPPLHSIELRFPICSAVTNRVLHVLHPNAMSLMCVHFDRVQRFITNISVSSIQICASYHSIHIAPQQEIFFELNHLYTLFKWDMSDLIIHFS